jgi:hypothetical protein
MTVVHRGSQHETDVLIRRVDAQLARLRSARQALDLDLAERLVDCLRQLILVTTHASAADRARVRAAVHYFVLRRAGRRSIRPLVADLLVINDVARRLGRPDLCVGPVGGSPPAAEDSPERQHSTAAPADGQPGERGRQSGPPDRLAG